LIIPEIIISIRGIYILRIIHPFSEERIADSLRGGGGGGITSMYLYYNVIVMDHYKQYRTRR